MTGRRTKLTPKIHKDIVAKVATGVPFKYAALASGVSETSFFKWKKIGIEELNDIEELDGEVQVELSIHAEFVVALKEAEAEAIARNVGIIQVAATESWQAAAWYLERRNFKEFGRKEFRELNHSGNIQNDITLSAGHIIKMNPKERLEYAKELESKQEQLDSMVELADEE